MKLSHLLAGVSAAFIFGGAALAVDLPVFNPGFEIQVGGEFGTSLGWVPNSGWASHASFPKPNNGTLGARFSYYTPLDVGGTAWMGQIVQGIRLEPNTTYTFKSWAIGGGDGVGAVPYEIAYGGEDDNIGSYVTLARNEITVGDVWAETAGVTYTTGAAGSELGKQLIIRFAGGTSNDVWLDNVTATANPVPEPATIAALSVGALALIRRRRSN